MKQYLPGEDDTAEKFALMQWGADVLEKYDLPDIGYPIPIDIFPQVITGGGIVEFHYLLFWMQVYSVNAPNWPELESAMFRLADLCVEPDNNTVGTAQDDEWFVALTPIDMNAPTVAIQRGNQFLAGLQNSKDGRLRLAAFHPLDANAIRRVFSLARIPEPDTGVNMRRDNWQYALDASCAMGNIYADQRGESYLCFWEYGSAKYKDGTFDEVTNYVRDAKPLAPRITATMLGIHYGLCGDDF